MKKTEYSHLKIVFFISTLFLISISIFSFIRIKNLTDASQMVNHTNLVKLELENIFSNLKDIESEQRGYMLTNDSSFINHTKIAEKKIKKNLKNFDSLTVDNSSEQLNAIKLKNLINEKLNNQSTISKEATITKIGLIRWQRGKKIMNDVRNQIDKMIAEEDFLLKKRTLLFSKETSITPILTIFLTFSVILILFISYYQITKELKISIQLKTELEIKEEDLRKNNNLLIEKNDLLVKVNKELESFTYISSHDLQEPLRKIQTFIGRILDVDYQNLSTNGKDYLNRTIKSANRMQTLIQDLLAYSRTKSENKELEKIDLNDLFEVIKYELNEEIEEHKIEIITSNLMEVKIMETQFRQVILNLISNAIKFSKKDETTIINVESKIVPESELNPNYIKTSDNYCLLKISDNGIGFDPVYNEKIFEVFQRLHSKDDFEGTGIGLAIVKKIMENHKGFIEAEGIPNQGATFLIYLPV